MIKFLKDRILPLFMVAWLGGLLPACINEGEETTNVSNDGGLFISIAISAGNAPAARAEGDELLSGTFAENFIDIEKGLQIYAFSIPENDNKDESKFLTQIYPYQKNENENVIGATVKRLVNGTYMLEAELNHEFFDNHQEFLLVAVANWNTFMEDPLSLTDQSSLSDLEKTFSIGTKIQDSKAWVPVPDKNEGIPMFGLHKTSLVNYDKRYHNELSPLSLGTVNMLRAMAKIEIIDALADGMEIIDVSISRYNREGYFTPSLDATQLVDTENVTSSNIPNPVSSSESKFTFVGENKTFVAYLPEYELNATNREDIITVTIEKDADDSSESYFLSLAPYITTDGINTPNLSPTESYWKALLRNHIYRYTIVAVNAPEEVKGLTINYTVCPMDEKTSGDITFE